MRVLELVARAARLEEVLDEIISALEALMPGARCSILVVDASGQALTHGAAPSLPATYLRAIDGIRIGPKAGSCGTAAFLGEPVIVSDVRDDDRWTPFRDVAMASGLVACWSSPILDPREDTIGTFAVYHDVPHHPTARERRLVERVTALASVALEHGRLMGELTETAELFRRFFDDNPAGAALLGLDIRFERVNSAFARMSGCPAATMVGAPLHTVLPVAAPVEKRIRNVLNGSHEAVITELLTVHAADGTRRPVEVTFSLVRGRDNLPAHVALDVVDLTAQRAAQAARAARDQADLARRIAEEHSRAKSALLSAVSHEVRTPLQAIKGFSELLSTLDLSGDQRREALARINVAADHLLSVVTDVLDVSRAEAGVLTVGREPVNVAEVAGSVVDLLAAEATARRVTIDSHIEATVTVLCDRGRLRQVLLNIVGNAIRHGRRAGLVQIRADRSAHTVRITVTDDGPGIAAEQLPQMFTPFARAETASDVDGYGLGLMLSSGLVAAMGGEITVDNADGGGAVFTVVLPGGTTSVTECSR
ncbi:ATP-binding protein [Williamsia sp. CHRR-6]|uniref:sensor histidine kinase n=1 Tax=Williamsia sp. CHRR-6 TaxID=2835871 RepID=UPI001BDA77A7|nr:ATP-binding protein [Williamsia sp. CHRR-6]MBT0566201.1 GAF domain-containing protein [Williamsia sp. CHRR-6]